MTFVVDTYEHLTYIAITASRARSTYMISTNFLALATSLGITKEVTVKVPMNNTNAIVRVLVIRIDSRCYNIFHL